MTVLGIQPSSIAYTETCTVVNEMFEIDEQYPT